MEVYPMTGWQSYLMGLEENRQANIGLVGLMTISSALWVRPGVDARRLNRAFQGLGMQHDVMRSQFHKLGGIWKCAIKPIQHAVLEVHDLQGTPEQDIETVTRDFGAKLIPMVDPALVRLDLLKFGSLGDVVVFRAHHSVTDAFGLMILTEDLIKLALGLPLESAGLSYADFYRKWGCDSKSLDAQSNAYWERKLLPPAEPANIGRVKRGLPILARGRSWPRSKTMTFAWGKKQMQDLEILVRQEGLSPFVLVNAAFLETVAEIASADDILYSVTLGRSDGLLARFAGHHTLHPLMRYRSQSEGSLVSGARATASELTETVQHLPSAAGRRDGAWDRRLLDVGCYPRQITTGGLSSSARVKASPLAELFSLGQDQTLSVGGKVVKAINLPDPPGGLDELNFRPSFSENGSVIHFKYDMSAFSDDEIDALADGTFSRLGIQPVSRHLLE